MCSWGCVLNNNSFSFDFNFFAVYVQVSIILRTRLWYSSFYSGLLCGSSVCRSQLQCCFLCWMQPPSCMGLFASEGEPVQSTPTSLWRGCSSLWVQSVILGCLSGIAIATLVICKLFNLCIFISPVYLLHWWRSMDQSHIHIRLLSVGLQHCWD